MGSGRRGNCAQDVMSERRIEREKRRRKRKGEGEREAGRDRTVYKRRKLIARLTYCLSVSCLGACSGVASRRSDSHAYPIFTAAKGWRHPDVSWEMNE